jgi:toxin ParE1/3/4
MKTTFMVEAQRELTEAASRYSESNPSLGMEFRQAVRRVVALIIANSRIGKPMAAGRAKGLREFVLDRFPYSVVYRIGSAGITIVAISHQQRRAGYWGHRVEEPAPMYSVRLAA